MNSLMEIAKVIRRSRRFFLCGHINPDGDSIGSVLALGLALESLGKEVVMASPDPVPENLSFLPSVDRIKNDFHQDYVIDTFVMLDCSCQERLGSKIGKLAESAREIIVLDHHPSEGCGAAYSYIDDRAAAAGEIVYDLLQSLNIVLTPEIAVCLYAAITTDTGSFQYQNTTPQTHRRAAQLLACGINVAEVSTSLYGEKPLAHIQLLAAALNNLKLSSCGRVAWISVTGAMLSKLRGSDHNVVGLINYPRMIKGVEVALLFEEVEPELFKVGFRSKGEIDVNQIARTFDGGGHIRASGCRIKGTLAEVEEKVLAEVYKAIKGNEA